jgi:hypothetical protein
MEVWSNLALDATGILLFLVWLALPPLYLVVLGRSYLRRCQVVYQRLRDHGCECDCCCEPDQETEEFTALDEPVATGRHALRTRSEGL